MIEIKDALESEELVPEASGSKTIEEDPEVVKASGNDAFKGGRFSEAVDLYSKAIGER